MCLNSGGSKLDCQVVYQLGLAWPALSSIFFGEVLGIARLRCDFIGMELRSENKKWVAVGSSSSLLLKSNREQ